MKEHPIRSYTVKKYVRARSVAQAIRIANDTPVHEVVIEDDPTEKNDYTEAIGYHLTQEETDEVPDEYVWG